jgi:hypothetical protein
MTPKIITIGAILAAVAMLAGIVSTIPITSAYSDEGETESNLKCNGSGTTSGQSSVDNSISCDQGSGGIGGQNEEGSGGIGGQPGSDEELQVRQVIGDVVSVSPRDLETSLASCAAGEVVTGGGFNILDDTNEINPSVWSFKDDDSEAWSVQLFNPGPATVFINAFAECAS